MVEHLKNPNISFLSAFWNLYCDVLTFVVFLVSRIEAQSQTYNLHLTLDVNTEIYPLKVNDRFSLAIATTLRKDGVADEGCFDQSGFDSLADDFEYVMFGKVFKHHVKPGDPEM
jgi:hypothetical protein